MVTCRLHPLLILRRESACQPMTKGRNNQAKGGEMKQVTKENKVWRAVMFRETCRGIGCGGTVL
jgi:hypothetical protein